MRTLREVLEEAGNRRVAVGHFNFSELVVLKAAAEAASETDAVSAQSTMDSLPGRSKRRQPGIAVMRAAGQSSLNGQAMPHAHKRDIHLFRSRGVSVEHSRCAGQSCLSLL